MNDLCAVCQKNKAVGVAAIPMVPMSCAYCEKCLQANAHPFGILVANTWLCGSLEECNEDWQAMVKDTCAHLGRSLDEFNEAVRDFDRAAFSE